MARTPAEANRYRDEAARDLSEAAGEHAEAARESPESARVLAEMKRILEIARKLAEVADGIFKCAEPEREFPRALSTTERKTCLNELRSYQKLKTLFTRTNQESTNSSTESAGRNDNVK
jgi:hypothetical protein